MGKKKQIVDLQIRMNMVATLAEKFTEETARVTRRLGALEVPTEQATRSVEAIAKRLGELEKGLQSQAAAMRRTPAQVLREWRHADVPLAVLAEALNVPPAVAAQVGRCKNPSCKCQKGADQPVG